MNTKRRQMNDSSRRLDPALRTAIRRKLLRWYDQHADDLPWRHRRHDPYAQWVAEIMLQQTRVETVVDYYQRFLKKFPTLLFLAHAKHEQVLKCWEGLGYYRRILYLHRAARQLVDQGRDIPESADALRQLPGVGEYTAAAIASIAFGQREAAVDGNVVRVLSRLLGVTHDVQSTIGRSLIRDYARQFIPVKRPGDFNQAWMDLGRRICTPRSPKCSQCPLGSVCVSAGRGLTHTLPVRNRKNGRAVPRVSHVVGVFVHRGRMLVRRRPTGGLWSGLWEFPGLECKGKSGDVNLVREVAKSEGITLIGRPGKIGVIHHLLTHRSLRFHVYVCRASSRDPRKKIARCWAGEVMFQKLPVSTAHRKIFSAVKDAHCFSWSD